MDTFHAMRLRKLEMKRKSQNSVDVQASLQSPLQNYFLAIVVKTCAKADIKILYEMYPL